MTMEERIEAALKIAMDCGGYDGDHHKMWVIDQMVRCLTDCPALSKERVDVNGLTYAYTVLGESQAYKELIRRRKDGEDGPDTYEWDVGIPP